MYKLFFLLSIIFAANTCEQAEASNPKTKTIYIGSTLVDCTGLAPQKCLLYKETPEEEWTFFYDDIAGFEYEEGYLYTLTVRITPVAEPLADASSLSYTLIKILKKEKDPTFTDKNTSVNTKIKEFSYFETTRGYQKKILITSGKIAVFKNQKEKAVTAKKLRNKNWKKLTTLSKAFTLSDIPTWQAPSQKRHRDAAAHTTLTIKTEDSTYISRSFDAGVPPEQLETLVEHILELAKNLDIE